MNTLLAWRYRTIGYVVWIPLMVSTPWLPPGGSCRNKTAALRNRCFRCDWWGVAMAKGFRFPPLNGENRNIYHSSNCVHLPTCRHPSSASLRSAASPRGKPRALRASGALRRWHLQHHLQIVYSCDCRGAFFFMVDKHIFLIYNIVATIY